MHRSSDYKSDIFNKSYNCHSFIWYSNSCSWMKKKKTVFFHQTCKNKRISVDETICWKSNLSFIQFDVCNFKWSVSCIWHNANCRILFEFRVEFGIKLLMLHTAINIEIVVAALATTIQYNKKRSKFWFRFHNIIKNNYNMIEIQFFSESNCVRSPGTKQKQHRIRYRGMRNNEFNRFASIPLAQSLLRLFWKFNRLGH